MDVVEAIKEGDEGRVRTLLAANRSHARARDENGVSALLLARYYGRAGIVELILATGLELDVFEAAALGQVPTLVELLDEDPELVNRWSPDGFSPLQLASFFGQLEAASVLLERGAETNAVAKNAMRVTALHSACAGGHTRIAGLLVDHGADVNSAQEGGYRPLHAAAQNGDLELARLLLDHGADPTLLREGGETPIETAEAQGHEDVAALLRRQSA